jgi:hypothetical protein
MLLTLDLGVWDEPTKVRSLPHPIPQFSDEAAASCLQSVTQIFLQYASCSPPEPSISSVIHDQHSSVCIIPCLLFCFMIQGLKVIWVPVCWKNWHCVWILLNAGDYRFTLESSTVLLQGFHLHWRSSILYARFPGGHITYWTREMLRSSKCTIVVTYCYSSCCHNPQHILCKFWMMILLVSSLIEFFESICLPFCLHSF